MRTEDRASKAGGACVCAERFKRGRRASAWTVAVAVLALALLLMLPTGGALAATSTITFTGTELLGQPTDTSVALKVVPDSAVSLRVQYGTAAGGPYSNTS